MALKALEPEEIGYKECAEALTKMWMDDILTDSEYGYIMYKLKGYIMYKLNENLKKEGD